MIVTLRKEDNSLFEMQSRGDEKTMRKNAKAAGLKDKDIIIKEVSKEEWEAIVGAVPAVKMYNVSGFLFS